MEKSIGQAAYEKYFETSSYPNGFPAWDRRPPDSRKRWEEIALAAVQQQADNDLAEAEKRLDAQMGESDG